MTKTTIEINEKLFDKKIGVKFPFELKDNFKESFKSARWKPEAKLWVVGKNTKKRLLQWINEVQASGILETIDTLDEHRLNEKELSELRYYLSNLKRNLDEKYAQLETLQTIKSQHQETRESIKKNKEELADLWEKFNISSANLEDERKKTIELVKGVLDFELIEQSRKQIISNHCQLGSGSRSYFHRAQNKIKKEIDKLTDLNLSSAGLNRLYEANFNRPDRDRTNEITLDDILDIEKIN